MVRRHVCTSAHFGMPQHCGQARGGSATWPRSSQSLGLRTRHSHIGGFVCGSVNEPGGARLLVSLLQFSQRAPFPRQAPDRLVCLGGWLPIWRPWRIPYQSAIPALPSPSTMCLFGCWRWMQLVSTRLSQHSGPYQPLGNSE